MDQEPKTMRARDEIGGAIQGAIVRGRHDEAAIWANAICICGNFSKACIGREVCVRAKGFSRATIPWPSTVVEQLDKR
jgi:hypothetical protein